MAQKKVAPVKSKDFENYIYEEIKKALTKPLADKTEQIYALSFFVYDMDDNPIIPTLTFGYNTEDQIKHHVKNGEDPEEVRWNYAFWLQNDIAKIGPYDAAENKTLFQIYSAWLKGLGINFTASQLDALQDKAEESEDEDILDMLEDAMTLVKTEFTAICCRVSLKLHEQGVIKAALGRPVPVIVHELEIFDDIAEQTKVANPADVAKDFYKWVMDKYD